MRNYFKHIYIFLIILFLAVGTSFSADGYNNSLLNANLSKSEIDGININLSTSKPYQDKVVVNKKSDTEYVILMPETTNSTVSKPSLNGVSDIVSDVSVKTQQTQGNIKGYTKITITTKKPVTINPKVKVAKVQNQISDKELAELLSSAKASNSSAKTPTKQVKTQQKALQPVQKKLPENNKNSFLANAQKNLKQKVQKSVNNSKLHNVAKVTKATDKNLNKTINKSEKIKVSKTTENLKLKQQQPSSAVKLQNVEQATQSETKPINQNVTSPENATAEIPQNVEPQTEEVNDLNSQIQPEQEASTTQAKPKLKAILVKYLVIIRNHILIIVSLVVFAVLSMLLMARNMTKTLKNVKESFNSNLKEVEKAAINYNEKIDEDMTWQEKYKACSDEENLTDAALNELDLQNSDVEDDADFASDIDNLFNPSEEITEEKLSEIPYSQTSEMISDIEDISVQNSTEQLSEQLAEDTMNYADGTISQLEPEQMFEENEELLSQNINLPVSDINPADYENEELYDENLSAQDLFAEDEAEILQVPLNVTETDSLDNTEIVDQNEVEIIDDISEEDNIIESDAKSDEQFETQQNGYTDLSEISDSDDIFQIYENEYLPNQLSEEDVTLVDEVDEISEPNDDEIIKSEFVIDENKSFYLVDLDESSALVGHINDEIFVLKRFESIVNAPLKARINEEEVNSTRYMTRVGSFRGVVEVTSDRMNLLVEL